MIRAAARTAVLVQRLRNRAVALAGRYAAARAERGSRRRSDWHSASALWPDFTGERRDGK